jgi:hypothetical protein
VCLDRDSTGDHHREDAALEGLDLALQAAQRLKKAITAFQDAVTIYQETGDEYRHGIALSGSANGHGAIAPFGPLQVNDAHQHRSQ